MSQLLGQTPGSSRSVSYHQPRPSSGVGIFTAAPGASFLFTEGKGFREENPALSPKVDPRPVGLRGGGKRWVLTSQSRESGATAMQASWGPSSASRCLRNVLSWELPRSFPHHPQPLIPSYACSSTAFTTTPSPFLSFLFHLSMGGPQSTVPQMPCHSPPPSQTSEGVTGGRSPSASADPMG